MQHQQGGAQYGGATPQSELAPFPSSANPRPQFPGIPTGHAEAAAPISSRPPPAAQNFGELAVAATGSFHDEDALAAGEDAERGGTPGNRWPREETLALLKIRSEMDAEFRDASLKGPLWENVSRKLGELGYIRSAKKCKEKFENVHKYYKRTKEGRAGRQDGKSYRFFSQLEALHTSPGGLTIGSGSGSNTPMSMSNPIPALPAPVTAATPTWANIQPPQPPPVIAPTPTPFVTPPAATHATQGTMPSSGAGATTGISLSSDTFTSSSYDSDDDEDTEEGGGGPSTEGRKRKRGSGSGSGGPTGSRKMMAFFEGLMMQVMEKQEAMQQRFLETIEKREQERMVREEAWRRQEMARLNREHELLAQERAVAASRDSALIQFLQKIGGQPIQVPPPPPAAAVFPSAPPPRPVVIPIPVTPPPRPVAPPAVPPPPPPPQQESPKELPPPQPQHQQHPPQQKIPPQQPPPQQPPPHELHHAHQTSETVVRNLPSSSCTELVPVPEQQELAVAATPRGAFEPGVTPSRWPKSEVHALIKLRSGLEPRYQEAGPKGPLWEEISLGMQRLGYNRSSKRCKEKWENINKYFKKVKESNKKRPEDAKTCPYFHQLDALYRKKNLPSTSNAGYSIESNPQALTQAPPLLPAQPVQEPVPLQIQHENERKNGDDNTGNQGGIQIQTSNGGLPPSFFEGGSSGGATMNKPEDIMKELMEQQHRRQATMNHYSKLEESRNDHNMYDDDDDDDVDDDDEDDEEDDDGKMVYKMQFERQNVGSGSGSGGGAASTKPAAATTAGSFLGMVQ